LIILTLDKLPENSGALYKLKKDPNDANETLEFKYTECKKISHDTYIYTYEIPDNLPLGLNLGQHIAIE
jgi:NAD(P)H-flavin reductase